MRKILLSFIAVIAFVIVIVPKASALVPPPLGAGGLPIAFISDAHVQDVVGHPELVRSQEVQVQSTRLFNENYFALCAALDDCGKRGVKLVVMPGDLTDNGQIVNQECVRDILNRYGKKYGMSFFVCFGNHDPSRPFGSDNTGSDFLAPDGSRRTITSIPSSPSATVPSISATVPSVSTLVSPPLGAGGLPFRGATIEEQTLCYRDFGFYPQKKYRYWATPYSSYTFDNYSFKKASKEASMKNRQYLINDTLKALDASYVVEPVDGIWLLALDGSVYFPKGMKDGKMEYNGSELGYNNLLAGRKHLVDWVKTITTEAKKRGKTLITFCHYPIVDFNDGASEYIARSWGPTKFDLHRSPNADVTKALMDAGVQLHFGGHMHVNDTGVKTDGEHTLVNIQCPSPALYVPAYKLLTIKSAQRFSVETVTLDDVPGFDTLFPLYQKEYDYDVAHGKQPIWSIEALQSKTYKEFCDWQFRDLTRVRFIPRDIPAKLREKMSCGIGFEIMLDLYRLRYAGQLANSDSDSDGDSYITKERIARYREFFEKEKASTDDKEYIEQIESLEGMFDCFLKEEPCINFEIDFTSPEPVKALK